MNILKRKKKSDIQLTEKEPVIDGTDSLDPTDEQDSSLENVQSGGTTSGEGETNENLNSLESEAVNSEEDALERIGNDLASNAPEPQESDSEHEEEKKKISDSGSEDFNSQGSNTEEDLTSDSINPEDTASEPEQFESEQTDENLNFSQSEGVSPEEDEKSDSSNEEDDTDRTVMLDWDYEPGDNSELLDRFRQQGMYEGTIESEIIEYEDEEDLDNLFKVSTEVVEAVGPNYSTGWLVCTEGPYKGFDFRLGNGWNRIGASVKNDISLPLIENIQDMSHLSIVFDSDTNVFYMVPDSIVTVLCNDESVQISDELNAGDTIKMEESSFIFIPFCNEKNKW